MYVRRSLSHTGRYQNLCAIGFLEQWKGVVPLGSTLALLLIGQAAKIGRRGLLVYLSMILPFPRETAPVIASLAFFTILWFIIRQEKIPGEKLGRG